MIYVDRQRVPRPGFFESAEFRAFLARFERHQRSGGSRKVQYRFPLDKELEPFRGEALEALQKLFHGKCAYTEELLVGGGTIVFHRPPGDALGLEGEVSAEHYWWLVADWSNWYLASERVASVKGTQFPVVGPRAEVGQLPTGDDPLDLGLLLDPCRDRPAWYLGSGPDGRIGSRPHPSPLAASRFRLHDRGEATIVALSLNQGELAEARAAVYREGRARRNRHPNLVHRRRMMVRATGRELMPDAPFLAGRRQALARALLWDSRFLADLGREAADYFALVPDECAAELLQPGSKPAPRVDPAWLEPIRVAIERECPDLVGQAHVERLLGVELASSASVDLHPPHQAPASSSSAASSGPQPRTSGSVGPTIERSARLVEIRVRNFKAIEMVELTIPTDPVLVRAPYGSGESDLHGVPWTALLGENGCGKSCLLQAVALALAGEHLPALLEESKLSWSRLLRRGSRSGRVLLGFAGGATIDLRFNTKRHWWVGGEPRVHSFVRGYGATRLADGEGLESSLRVPVRLTNLFDPRAPVVDAKAWLLSLDEGDFNAAALTIGELVRTRFNVVVPGVSEPPRLERDSSAGEIRVDGDPLEQVSDGYRAVVSMVCDLLAGLASGLSDLRHAVGIVLIDEIGAHLHPRWRMEIAAALRRALPNLQLLVSTHEPLCLRGFERGEVVRVRRLAMDDPSSPVHRRVELERIDRSPSDFRVDQLLTSEFFGLDTTVDPDLDRRFQAYYRLLALSAEERTPQLDAELARLRAELHQRSSPALGHTRRDQLVYEAIDQLLATQDQLDPAQRAARRRATIARVQEIWAARRGIAMAGDPS